MRSLLVLLLVAGAAHAGGAPDPEALEHLVKQDCGSCHGLTLKGGLGPDIRPEAISHFDAETLSEVVLDGIPGTAMPPWRPLMSEAEAAWIAEYLLTGEHP
ncbi:cytochrome c55X [Aliiruegeria haliotis]|uniref:Cytochrome c55X n=1 Tax=Aliiruegeria haliotis TaxID=1280846 RepID=A0A2T0RKZ8_9RHOB|nr:cytochrome c [Aliiruegeria haliotis]PRY21869.1 cytochrome c55X [Aliiruegeria haliotis]